MASKAVRLDVLTLKDMDQFFGYWGKGVVEGSPMACALIATSVVESALMTLLNAFFVKGKTTEGLFEIRGLLGDFFKCIQIASCIGLISKRVKQTPEKVPEIRNACAHTKKLIDFDD